MQEMFGKVLEIEVGGVFSWILLNFSSISCGRVVLINRNNH